MVGEFLAQVFSLLLSFLEPCLQTWLPVLIAFGIWLKKKAKVDGKLIPFAEVGAGFLVAGITCLGKGMGVVEVIGFIIGQGLLLAFFSMGIYNLGKAVIKIVENIKNRVATSIEEVDEILVNKEETK